MKNVYTYEFNLCSLSIAEENGALCNILFSHENITDFFERKENSVIKQVHKQLEEYFNGKRKAFDLPLAPRGTEFQKKIWDLLKKIPYGETRSYGQIAAMADNPKGSRAVGMANNRNPLPVVIPCHRVIGSGGALTGYAGGLDLKQKLLELEKSAVLGGKRDKRN